MEIKDNKYKNLEKLLKDYNFQINVYIYIIKKIFYKQNFNYFSYFSYLHLFIVIKL